MSLPSRPPNARARRRVRFSAFDRFWSHATAYDAAPLTRRVEESTDLGVFGQLVVSHRYRICISEAQTVPPLASRLSRGTGISSMRGSIGERGVEVVCAPGLSLHGYAGPGSADGRSAASETPQEKTRTRQEGVRQARIRAIAPLTCRRLT